MSKFIEAFEHRRCSLKKVCNALSSKITITPDNISSIAYPIVEFIFKEKPDYVIACDRGARMIGLATHALYGELYGSFPTVDHSVNFRKISRKIPTELARNQLERDIEKLLRINESPKIFILDDWMFSGKTFKRTRELIEDISDGRATVLFGLMIGGGKMVDISGDKLSLAFCDKRDRDQERGFFYDSEIIPHKNISLERSISYKKRMHQRVREFAREVKTKNHISCE